jgi:hypothetical protein
LAKKLTDGRPPGQGIFGRHMDGLVNRIIRSGKI